MARFIFSKTTTAQQYVISVLLVCLVSGCCYLLSPLISYRIVALLLLVTVSLVAMLFGIMPVMVAALLSALTWDFFFIPPRLTFSVASAEDLLMLFMYFIIASVNAVLTFKIRQIEKTAREKEEKAHTVKLYNTMLNSLSHELRTPIATIIGATDHLLADNKKITDVNRQTLLAEISAASLRLNRQVENLLNMSRLESGFIQPKKDWCDVNELVYEVIHRLPGQLKEHQVNVSIAEGLPLFRLDFGLMEQVIYNLLYNITVHTPGHTTVTISADCVENMLQLVIADNGPGFPAGETGKVFDKFYRLNHTHTGGIGLGLSIVKGFTEAHNGTVKLENRAGGGAVFTLSIPAETAYLNPAEK